MNISSIVEQKKNAILQLLSRYNFSRESNLKITEIVEEVSRKELEYELKTNDFNNIYSRIYESSLKQIEEIQDQNIKKDVLLFLNNLQNFLRKRSLK